jgi:hypothetical protein
MRFLRFFGVVIICLFIFSSACVQQRSVQDKPFGGKWLFGCPGCGVSDPDNVMFYSDQLYTFNVDGTGSLKFSDKRIDNFTWKMVTPEKILISFDNSQTMRTMKYPEILENRGGYLYYYKGELQDGNGFRFTDLS